jgi:hypothetical protein
MGRVDKGMREPLDGAIRRVLPFDEIFDGSRVVFDRGRLCHRGRRTRIFLQLAPSENEFDLSSPFEALGALFLALGFVEVFGFG